MVADGGELGEGRLESGPQVTNLPHKGFLKGVVVVIGRCR